MRPAIGSVLVALVVSCGFLAAVAPAASAGKPLPPAAGEVTCTVGGGKVSFKPKLTAAPQPNVVAKFSLSFKPCAGTTGNPAAILTGATLKGVSAPYTASCTSPQPPTLTATVKWKAKHGKFATSSIAWSASSGDGDHIVLPEAASTITGSYAADIAAMSLVRLKSADCTKGIAGWNVTSSSSLALEAPCASFGPDGRVRSRDRREWSSVVGRRAVSAVPGALPPHGHDVVRMDANRVWELEQRRAPGHRHG